MYEDTVLGPCPFNGARYEERWPETQVSLKGAVGDLSELVEGSTYQVYRCADLDLRRIALPPEKEKWDHVKSPKMVFRGLNSDGLPLFDVEGDGESCEFELDFLGLAPDDRGKWSHYCGLIPA